MADPGRSRTSTRTPARGATSTPVAAHRLIASARVGLASMNNLAAGYYTAGKLDLALPLLEETLKLTKIKQGADHPDTLASTNNLAEGYRAADKLDLALPLHEETLKLTKAKLGADHPDTPTGFTSRIAEDTAFEPFLRDRFLLRAGPRL